MGASEIYCSFIDWLALLIFRLAITKPHMLNAAIIESILMVRLNLLCCS